MILLLLHVTLTLEPLISQELTWSNEAPIKTTMEAKDQTQRAQPHLTLQQSLLSLSDLLLDRVCDPCAEQDLVRIFKNVGLWLSDLLGIIGVAQINLQAHRASRNWILKHLTPPDIFRLTTGPDQAFDPIFRMGKSAVNQADNPLAYHTSFILSLSFLPLSLSLIPLYTSFPPLLLCHSIKSYFGYPGFWT